MTTKMTMSEAGYKFLESLESFRAEAYKDEAGKWTIGYGRTENVKQGDKVDEKTALQDIRIHVSKIEDFLNEAIKVPLEQNQFDALVSFVYNVGISAFHNSQLMQMLNHKCYDTVPYQMKRWKYITVKNGKQESMGLINRREREADLWMGIDPKYYKKSGK